MRLPKDNDKPVDKVILLLLLALFLLVSPFMAWWATPDAPWYRPYLIWLFIIALTWWLQYRNRRP